MYPFLIAKSSICVNASTGNPPPLVTLPLTSNQVYFVDLFELFQLEVPSLISQFESFLAFSENSTFTLSRTAFINCITKHVCIAMQSCTECDLNIAGFASRCCTATPRDIAGFAPPMLYRMGAVHCENLS